MYLRLCIYILLFEINSCFLYEDFSNIFDFERQRRQRKIRFINHTSFFPSLSGTHVNALPATITDYPYIAEVIHSKTNDYPHVCTATCIDERIFITAARCIYTLKLAYTRIKYQQHLFDVRAFVVPSNPSKQMYDDIGLVVVEPSKYNKKWYTIKTYNKARPNKDFKWFETMKTQTERMTHRVIGFVLDKITSKAREPSTEYQLKYIDVQLGKDMCSQIFTVGKFKGFEVPCFHSCSIDEFKLFDKKCARYLGEEGAPVVNVQSNLVIGVSTWGATFAKYELPVGLAVPNSVNFYKDQKCAIKIRDDTTSVANLKTGHYQSLCKK